MLCANRLVVNATSLKPTSFGFAGSNPASRIFLYRLYSSEVEHHTCNVGVSGSIPDEGMMHISLGLPS